ncbi:DUF6049 family protein [Kitasatospora sp. CB01950]|uniref:DUF6049 family protein n=1 Tax=Kitasatospora sp. CB01950 TaxID=1703930 RepID=UPI00093CA5C5|nr:DUF6049 family protein [Kitasatospora sp. CB01950]
MNERTGRGAAGAGHRGRWTGLLARSTAALLAGGLVGAFAAAPAAAGPGTLVTAAGEYPAAVQIDTVQVGTGAPRIAHENDTVTITGKVTNSGSEKLKSPKVMVRVPSAGKPILATRSDIDLMGSWNTPSTKDGTALESPTQEVGDLDPGQSKDFTLPVPVSALGAKETGSYELAVDLWGSTSNEAAHPLGIARTYLPFQGRTNAQPSKVSVVWPLTHAPVLVAQTMPDQDQTPVLRDDSLVGELTGDGRLNKLVELGATMPGLTWAIDPDLLDTVLAMTKPYRVQKPGTSGESAREDNTVPGTGRDAATAWLTNLRKAVAAQPDSEVVSLPYADPDLASIAHNGAHLNGMDAALRKAMTAGQVTTEARLPVDARSDVAWPYRGLLDQRTASVAGAAGGRLVLVNGTSMPESDKLTYTPNAARPIGNGQTAVVSDAVLASLFQGDLSSPHDRTMAQQRFLAETLAIAHQEPEHPRGVLVLPSRSLTVGTAQALHDSMQAATGNGGPVAPVSLQKVADLPADPNANTNVPNDYPGDATGAELSAAEISATMGLQDGVDQLMIILTQPERVRGPFSAAMVRSMSTSWRDQQKAGVAYRAGVQHYLDNLKSAVRVPKKSTVTLPGDNATLLISVKNDLTQAVGNLELRVTSIQPNRLNVGENQPVVLDATTARTFRFPAEAQVNGQVQVTAELWTTGPNPQRYGEPVEFTVDVTSVASGVTYVIAGGTALMILAGIRFYLQRKKRRAAGEIDEDPDRPLSDGGGTDGSDGSDGPDGDDRNDGKDGGKDDGKDDGKDGDDGKPADADPPSDRDVSDRVAGDEKVDH